MKKVKYQGREVELNDEQEKKYESINYRRGLFVNPFIFGSLAMSFLDIYFGLGGGLATCGFGGPMIALVSEKHFNQLEKRFLEEVSSENI